MKIALTTVGSTGDIQPYVALALRLKAAGHTVRVVSHPFHEARFADRGIDFVGCGPFVTQDDLNEMLDKMLSTINPVKQLRMLMEDAFFEEGEKYFAQAKAATIGFDLAVSHMVDFLGQEAITQNNIPRIGIILAPAAIPTRFAPPVYMLNLGAGMNRLGWWMMAQMLRGVDRRAMRFLRHLGGTQQNIQRFSALSPNLNLIAASPLLCPSYPDLPEGYLQTGPWVLPEPEYAPPADLQQFLKKHPRPLIVSLGSMGGTQGETLTRKLLAAVKLAGVPAIIQSGYAGLFTDDAPSNVYFSGYVPHGWLFEQGFCVVHHGGAGTTHAVCRAGVPSVVLAFISDQPYFAEQLQRLGIAPKMIWHFRFTPKRLAQRILTVMNNKEMQARARALQAQFLSEEGVDGAVRHIEAFGKQVLHKNTFPTKI